MTAFLSVIHPMYILVGLIGVVFSFGIVVGSIRTKFVLKDFCEKTRNECNVKDTLKEFKLEMSKQLDRVNTKLEQLDRVNVKLEQLDRFNMKLEQLDKIISKLNQLDKVNIKLDQFLEGFKTEVI